MSKADEENYQETQDRDFTAELHDNDRKQVLCVRCKMRISGGPETQESAAEILNQESGRNTEYVQVNEDADLHEIEDGNETGEDVTLETYDANSSSDDDPIRIEYI